MHAQAEQVRRILVWRGWLRLAHWGIAFSSLLLLASGEIIKHMSHLNDAIRDYHIMLGSVLALALILRAILLFVDRGAGHWRALIPTRSQLVGMRAMLLFYLSFGRMPLPKWYAHNPFWIPVYVLLYGMLLLQVLSGFWQGETPFLAGFYLPDVHSVLATGISILIGLHIAAVFLHDLKGTGSDISAMINGHRIFVIHQPELPPVPSVHTVSLDQIKVKMKNPDER